MSNRKVKIVAFVVWLLSGTINATFALESSQNSPDFSRDIRPILSENCFHCHGPDEGSRESDLRLDTKEGLFEDRGGYHVVAPDDLENSELYRRIMSHDSSEKMPPEDSNRELNDEQKKLIKRWIESGATWNAHWAYLKPERPIIPQYASNKYRTTNPIDHFIVRELDSAGMAFSQAAEKHTLLRRVYFDLIGLPPSPEEIDSFLSDDALDAYERVVDRLLDNRHFGERWARPWLDEARYADSNGFQADQLRSLWAYRDWVIKAFNSNMPFDQFTIEQLAGDLLPNPTIEQKIATGFHRAVTCNVEAGVHPEENRFNQIVDRVNTTGTVWLGSTLECAQCHDHKFDPITTKNYYQFFAFFNNTPLEVEEPSSVSDVTHDFIGPYMDLPVSEEARKSTQAIDVEMKTLLAKLEKIKADPEHGFDAWIQHSAKIKDVEWTPVTIVSFSSSGSEDHRILPDESVLITGNVPETTTYEVLAKSPLKKVGAIRLEALTHEEIPGKGPGRGDEVSTNFVLSEFEISLKKANADRTTPIKLVSATADFSQDNWDAANSIDNNPKTGWAIAPQFGKDHWIRYIPAQTIEAALGDQIAFTLRQNWGRGRVIGRIKISVSESRTKFADFPSDIIAILDQANSSLNDSDRKKLQDYYLQNLPEASKIRARLLELKLKKDHFAPDKTLVMVEMKQPRTTTVMNRGNYLDPGQVVKPGTPEFLHEFDPQLPLNRLGLAKWIADERNPLTARVTVNRWWAEIFGRGLVATVEDFGIQSDPPTHRDLLNWLAVEFVDSGWDVKHIIRLMVTSEAYKQDSRITEEMLEKDPKNLLYARAPRFRLEAETIRDNALTVSGLLSREMYGEPTMPFQPLGLWNHGGRGEPVWREQENSQRWRRAIYIVYRRAAPYPSLVNFDAPDRSTCSVKRARTNTPTQALTLLNDPSYIEMALALADRILSESPSDTTRSRLEYGIRLVTGRAAKTKELSILSDALSRQTKLISETPGKAEAMVKGASRVYETKYKCKEELAAWLYIGNVLLNLDETITKG